MTSTRGKEVTTTYVELVEMGPPRKARRRGRITEFRYRIEVWASEPTLEGDSYAAKAINVERWWDGQVPGTVLHDFRGRTGKTREEAVESARDEVKAWIADGAPGSE